MKAFIAYLGAALPAFSAIIAVSYPKTPEEWVKTIIAALAAGFGGNAARGMNRRVKPSTEESNESQS